MAIWSAAAFVYSAVVFRRTAPPWRIFLTRLTRQDVTVADHDRVTVILAATGPWIVYYFGVLFRCPGIGNHPIQNTLQAILLGSVLCTFDAKIWSVTAEAQTLTRIVRTTNASA